MTATHMVSNNAIPAISEAVTAARFGDTVLAGRLLDQILDANPRNEQALLWKAVLCSTGETAEYYLEQVLEMNPSNEQAFETLKLIRNMNRDQQAEMFGGLSNAKTREIKPDLRCPVCCETKTADQESDTCSCCGMLQKLGSWSDYLANQEIDEVLMQKAVERWELGMERSPSAGTAFLLALGYLNLKRSGEACRYLEQARNMGVDEPGMDELIRYFRAQKLILAVDDNSLVRRFLNTILTRAGFRVVTAGSGDEGMKLFEQFEPDLVVCDYTSPGKNGFELCRQIRKEGWTTPVVLMSGRLVDKLKARLAGASDTLSKPFEPETLAATVRRNLAA
jgi:CheY-like chemotaxis protein